MAMPLLSGIKMMAPMNRYLKSEYRNGAWHHPAGLSDNISPDGKPAWAPQVAMDNNGNAIIVWSSKLMVPIRRYSKANIAD